MSSPLPTETRLQDILLLEKELQHLAITKKRERKVFNILLASIGVFFLLSLINIYRTPSVWSSWSPLILCIISFAFGATQVKTLLRANDKYLRFTRALASLHLTFDAQSHKLFYWTPISPPHAAAERTGIRGMRPPEPLYIPPSPTDARN